jgi:hypothetical protein
VSESWVVVELYYPLHALNGLLVVADGVSHQTIISFLPNQRIVFIGIHSQQLNLEKLSLSFILAYL